tara:strand:+ start:55656 stop:57590 length:1935 start_codon:yes stop_codon:yes gene_type:complete
MDFFANQDVARRKTKQLIFFFFLAIALITIAINAIVYAGVHYLVQYDPAYSNLNNIPYWMYITPIIVFVIAIGSLIKLITLRGGGLSVARMVNARAVRLSSNDFKEQRLINVVEEMSIASGVPMPKLFILDTEPAINAFVAGIKPNDTVLVVTKGALDNFNRAELQAVIGHEFSHIFNSDMRINLRLIGILAGILAIGQVGYFIMRSQTGYRRRSNKGGGAIALLGVGVLIIGYIGLFFGRLIKAAISRQRELLADASSVQYTRYPQGLVSAFKKMQMHQAGSSLNTDKVEDISHLCFGQALNFTFFQGMFATHPALEKRIQAIDPKAQYDILADDSADNQLSTDAQETKDENQDPFGNFIAPIAIIAATAGNAQIQTTKEAIKESIGNPSSAHLKYAAHIFKMIPSELMQIIHNPDEVELLYYVLILTRFSEDTSLYEKLAQTLSDDRLQKVKNITEILKPLPFDSLIPIFDLSLPAYMENSPDQRQNIYNNFENIVQHLEPSPFRFALLTILGKKLTVNNTVSDRPKYHTVEPLINDIAQLFAFILFFSHELNDPEAHFSEVLFTLTPQDVTLPTITEFKPIQFRCTLERLNGLTPELKSKLISACVDLILTDGQIEMEEAELLRAISECLDTPMPPILQQP